MSLSIIHIIDIVIYNYIDIVKCPRVLQSNYSLYTSNNSYIAKYNIQNRLINNTLINITVYPTAFIQNDFLLLQSTGQSIQSTTSLNVTLSIVSMVALPLLRLAILIGLVFYIQNLAQRSPLFQCRLYSSQSPHVLLVSIRSSLALCSSV